MSEDLNHTRESELIELGRKAELIASIRQVLGEELRSTLPEIVRPVVRDQVQQTLSRYYGDREPEQVLEVIRSAEKFHRRLNEMADNFWSTAFAFVVRWGFWLFLVGSYLSHSGWLKTTPISPPIETP